MNVKNGLVSKAIGDLLTSAVTGICYEDELWKGVRRPDLSWTLES